MCQQKQKLQEKWPGNKLHSIKTNVSFTLTRNKHIKGHTWGPGTDFEQPQSRCAGRAAAHLRFSSAVVVLQRKWRSEGRSVTLDDTVSGCVWRQQEKICSVLTDIHLHGGAEHKSDRLWVVKSCSNKAAEGREKKKYTILMHLTQSSSITSVSSSKSDWWMFLWKPPDSLPPSAGMKKIRCLSRLLPEPHLIGRINHAGVKWLAVLPYSRKVTGSIPNPHC